MSSPNNQLNDLAAKAAQEQPQAQKTHKSPPPDTDDVPEYAALEKELAAVQEQLEEAISVADDYKNQLLRNHAELDNIRKRAEKDVQNAHRYSLERLVTELLPVIDSLERGMSIEVGDNELAQQTRAGVEMTYKLFMDALEKLAIKPVNPLGEAFDPSHHQAISMQENPEVTANTVLQVLQKGYLLHDRLIRPALVVVAK